MKLTKEVLVAYDISETKARTKVYEGLKDLGYIPIQKSVFIGQVKPAEQKAARRLLHNYINTKTDRAFIIEGEFINDVIENGIGYTNEEFDIFGISYVL